MSVEQRESSGPTVEAIKVRTNSNFLEVHAASKYDGTVHITSWLNGTDLSDPKSYNPANPKEHKGIGVRVSQEDLPTVIEFLQAQVKPLPLLPTTAGSVVKATRDYGAKQATDVPRNWVLMGNTRWLSVDGWYETTPERLQGVEILFDAGDK